MKAGGSESLPYWKEYPERDEEFVRVYPTFYGKLEEEEVWQKEEAFLSVTLPKKAFFEGDDSIRMLKKEMDLYAKEPYIQELKFTAVYLDERLPAVCGEKETGSLAAYMAERLDTAAFDIRYGKAPDTKEDRWVLGIGMGACGHLNRKIYRNTEDIAEYRRRLEEGRLPVKAVHSMTAEEYMHRAFLFGLQSEGISDFFFYRRFGIGFGELYKGLIEELAEARLAELKGDRLTAVSRERYGELKKRCEKYWERHGYKYEE